MKTGLGRAAPRPGDLRAVLFDLDGTLLDSFQCHLEIYRTSLAPFGVSLDPGRFRRLYSPSWNEFYRRVGLAPAQWEAANAAWLRESHAHRPEPFPGTADTLALLSRHFRLGLVTSGSRARVTADLERGGLARFFQAVVTADDVREPKPAPEGLQTALRALELHARQALYVGDTRPDYEFARAAGVAFVGVRSGFSEPATSDGYVRLAAVSELPALLRVS